MIRCVAIDDEPIALSIIREYCRRYGDIQLRTFSSPISGMECIRQTRPDIVFLDIEMKSHNGVELARELPQGTCLIFTTAFAQYALDGFDVDAVDFLHKPIFYQRFERAMEKARRFIGNAPAPSYDVPGQTAIPQGDGVMGSITLKVEHKNVVVSLRDILYVEAMDNYVKIYRRNLPTVVSQITMKETEGMLPSGSFLRVHRSFIVALASVEKFSNRVIYLRDSDRTIPVGRKYAAAFNNLSNIFRPHQTL